MRVILGVTGPTGSGKTAVSDYLSKKGFQVMDADKIYHQLLSKGGSCHTAVVQHFGQVILDPAGFVDRGRLGKIVFSDPEKLCELSALVHPLISDEVINRIDYLSSKGKNLFAIDGAQILEADIKKSCDYIISVLSCKDIRISRIMKRDAISKGTATLRVAAQKADEYYTKQSDYVIINNQDIRKTQDQVDKIITDITSKER